MGLLVLPLNIYFKFITKYDGLLLQSVVLLQNEIVITKSATILSQSATGITKSDDYYYGDRTNPRIFLYVQKKPSSETYSVHDSDFVLLYKLLNNV